MGVFVTGSDDQQVERTCPGCQRDIFFCAAFESLRQPSVQSVTFANRRL
jgi:hypothetical protein